MASAASSAVMKAKGPPSDIASAVSSRCGIVVIGRNEGPRLCRCFASLSRAAARVVYVDSGSSDDSVAIARAAGVDVVEIRHGPMSAARARNAGFRRLRALHPDMRHVQFVDGDCELSRTWLASAMAVFAQRADVALVCGRLHERHPEASLYNRFCELEWRAPPGEIEGSGGLFMVRADVFEAADGFDETFVAGEEPELCHRLRRAGWRLLRLADDMACHDADIRRFREWWRRCVRSGHAFAEGAHRSRGGYWRREMRGIGVWGLALPVAAVTTAALWHPACAAALPGACVLLGLRVYRGARRRAFARGDAALYAALCVLAKFPHACGLVRFHLLRLLQRPPSLIEYKRR